MWISFLIAIFFIMTGIAIRVFKWYFLISGYNTMSKEKKDKVDIEGLARFMGMYLYANGIAFLAAGILQAVGFEAGVMVAWAFFGVSTIYLLIRAQKFDGNIYDENGKLREGTWKQLAIPAGIVAAILIGVLVLMFYSSQPTKVSFLEEGLQIQGMYGETYEWESIQEVRLIETLPRIEWRSNGSQIGPHLKGNFRASELGAVKLFVNVDKPPFVYLRTNNRIVIFNLEDEEETEYAYSEILSRIE